jgi:hypothetical protein
MFACCVVPDEENEERFAIRLCFLHEVDAALNKDFVECRHVVLGGGLRHLFGSSV